MGETEQPTKTALRIRAERPDRPATHFVFLMFDNNDVKAETTAIEIAVNPPAEVLRYNEGAKKKRASGKAMARDWRLQQWIGPFNTLDAAAYFQTAWAHSGKHLAKRIARGAQLARDMNLAVFTMHTITQAAAAKTQ